ncbi:hypothetical protein CP02DC14_0414B, partial [Chlamydia psittaci 02DC14]
QNKSLETKKTLALLTREQAL